ncbi:MAG TPA: SCO family protein [Verrucomicrobiae bacterium]|jgi:protein SCO1/2|nr:SCO family protein [Verrucomicrobiae bacterium]
MKRILTTRWTLLLLAFAICSLACRRAGAQSLSDDQLLSVTFEQNLNSQINRDLQFRDENGHDVRLGDYFGKKPVVLVLGYYQCPMLCTLTLNGLVQAMEDMKWTVGRDFEIINVSIDPRETPALAQAKKNNYLKKYGRAGADAGWHFLTGGEPAIHELTTEAGFKYVFDPASKQYAHPSGVVILTPDGKISRYLFGVTYHASDLFASLRDASGEKIGSPIQQLILLCFHYNPITGKYGAAIMLTVRLLGATTVIAVTWLIVFFIRREKTRPSLTLETSGTDT